MSDRPSEEPRLNLNELLTTKDVARLFKTCERTVQNQVKRGKLQSIRLGRCVRFNPEEIERVLNGDDDKPLSNQAI